MRTAIPFLLLALLTCFTGRPQGAAAQDSISSQQRAMPSFPVPAPSNEAFVNAVFHTVVDSSFSAYYLFGRADTCRFVKFNYEEWAQYTLKEPVSLVVLNELAEKVYRSKGGYTWRQGQLQKAICIDRKKADSVIFFTDDLLKDRSLSKRQLDQAIKKRTQEWQQLPPQEKIVFSFSQPQFTDDGQYAVIDLNFTCGAACGQGFTCLFRLTAAGWKLIAKYSNWSA